MQLLRWRAHRHRTKSNILLWLTIICVTALRGWDWTLVRIAWSFLWWAKFVIGWVIWYRMTLLSPGGLCQIILRSYSRCCCAIWRSCDYTRGSRFTFTVWKLFGWGILDQGLWVLRLLFMLRSIEVKICYQRFLFSIFRKILVSIRFVDTVNFVEMSFLWTYWLCNQVWWWFKILDLSCYLLLLVLWSVIINACFDFLVVK